MESVSLSLEDTNIPEDTNKPFRILLITNRDSDNTGDQVIEACDISLISTVMKNLHLESTDYVIDSRAAGSDMVPHGSIKNPALLENSEKAIENSDLVIFGGAPMFNFHYQPFYERTAIILELAQKYNTPVIFSAIGIEGYDENNKKCQRLKKALALDCVKQITTRDDFDSLQKFVDDRKPIPIAKVSDPAVFAAKIFEKFTADSEKKEKKKIGIFVLRANGFLDNEINYTRDDSAILWKGITRELEKKGYDYELLTSGHFADEAILDYMIRKHNMPSDKCGFNVNLPEILINKISSCDAVITCRLHPSIISFSMGIPCLGIVWNSKVNYFYDAIGYNDRIFEIDNIDSVKIAERIEQIMSEGVDKDNEYLTSVYTTLFHGIKNIMCPEDDIAPYDYTELIENISAYEGTPEEEQIKKLERKFKRIYEAYNSVCQTTAEIQDTMEHLKNIIQTTTESNPPGYTVIYNGGIKSDKLVWNYTGSKGEIRKLNSGSVEYKIDKPAMNNGTTELIKNGFSHPDHIFYGWKMRVRIDGQWFWFMQDKTLILQNDYNKDTDGERYLLEDESVIPHIPAEYIDTVVLEGLWKTESQIHKETAKNNPDEYTVIYNGGTKSDKLTWNYTGSEGEIRKLSSGSIEYRTDKPAMNDGTTELIKNGFSLPDHIFFGWKMRVKINGQWFWFMQDKTLILQNDYNKETDGERYLLEDGSVIPLIPAKYIDTVVLEGLWKTESRISKDAAKNNPAEYIVIYNSGIKSDKLAWNYIGSEGKLRKLSSGSVEYRMDKPAMNDGTTELIKNGFSLPDHIFYGWKMKVKIDGRWFWFMQDKTLILQNDYNKDTDGERYLLEDESVIPLIPVEYIDTVVLEGIWKAKPIEISKINKNTSNIFWKLKKRLP